LKFTLAFIGLGAGKTGIIFQTGPRRP